MNCTFRFLAKLLGYSSSSSSAASTAKLYTYHTSPFNASPPLSLSIQHPCHAMHASTTTATCQCIQNCRTNDTVKSHSPKSSSSSVGPLLTFHEKIRCSSSHPVTPRTTHVSARRVVPIGSSINVLVIRVSQICLPNTARVVFVSSCVLREKLLCRDGAWCSRKNEEKGVDYLTC